MTDHVWIFSYLGESFQADGYTEIVRHIASLFLAGEVTPDDFPLVVVGQKGPLERRYKITAHWERAFSVTPDLWATPEGDFKEQP